MLTGSWCWEVDGRTNLMIGDDIFAGDIGLFEVAQMATTSGRNLIALRGQMIKWELRFSACHGKLKCRGKSNSQSLTSTEAK